ncbi:MAG TPA: YciI family protein [Casimicrobiaceae bacterium]|nr:YciI family protein [Casimicrobiaceae bacterium]
MRTSTRVLAILALTAVAIVVHAPASGQSPPKLQQFVYVLKVSPAFHEQSKWTQKENDAVGRHFGRLAEATKAGRVIFAGRTSEALDKTFGLVVFEADDEAAARQFMESDPAVAAGVMSATLHPYVLALQRKP